MSFANFLFVCCFFPFSCFCVHHNDLNNQDILRPIVQAIIRHPAHNINEIGKRIRQKHSEDAYVVWSYTRDNLKSADFNAILNGVDPARAAVCTSIINLEKHYGLSTRPKLREKLNCETIGKTTLNVFSPDCNIANDGISRIINPDIQAAVNGGALTLYNDYGTFTLVPDNATYWIKIIYPNPDPDNGLSPYIQRNDSYRHNNCCDLIRSYTSSDPAAPNRENKIKLIFGVREIITELKQQPDIDQAKQWINDNVVGKSDAKFGKFLTAY